jgi:superfamily II DNA/RNA helicase
MLEMGFKNTLNQILKNLPKTKTLFFSATLNNDIHKLADVSMTTPERVFLHTVNSSKN